MSAPHPGLALATARTQVAALISARAGEVVFTGSGSEANLLAVRGAVPAAGRARPHVITQATEHPAATLAAALDADTVLVSVMAANNETGALRPIAELAELAQRSRGCPTHSTPASTHPASRALAALRLSLCRWTTADELDRAARLLATAASTLAQQPAGAP